MSVKMDILLLFFIIYMKKLDILYSDHQIMILILITFRGPELLNELGSWIT
jgi:hypothetical protein